MGIFTDGTKQEYEKSSDGRIPSLKERYPSVLMRCFSLERRRPVDPVLIAQILECALLTRGPHSPDLH